MSSKWEHPSPLLWIRILSEHSYGSADTLLALRWLGVFLYPPNQWAFGLRPGYGFGGRRRGWVIDMFRLAVRVGD